MDAALLNLRKGIPDLFSDPGALTKSPLLAIPGKGIGRPVLSPDMQQLAFDGGWPAAHLYWIGEQQAAGWCRRLAVAGASRLYPDSAIGARLPGASFLWRGFRLR